MDAYLYMTLTHDFSDFLLTHKVVIPDLIPLLPPVGDNPARNHNSHLGRPGASSSTPLPAGGTDASLTENFQRPPTSLLLSKQVGSSPSSRQLLMEARPLMPAPTMATLFFMGACGEGQSSLPEAFLRTFCYLFLVYRKFYFVMQENIDRVAQHSH